MNSNDAICILKEYAKSHVLTCDLSLWYNRVWQFETVDEKKTILRLSLETFYNKKDGFYKPTKFEQESPDKIQLTSYLYIDSELLPNSSRELKKELGKGWKVWASGEIDLNLTRLRVDNGYLIAPMCRLRGKLNGHGITNLGSLAQEWEDTVILL